VNPGVIYIVLANVAAGTSYLAMAMAMEGLPPALVLLLRVVVSTAVIFPFLRPALRSRGLPFERRDWLEILGMSVVGLTVALLAGIHGLKLSSVTNASLLIGLEPVGIVLLSALFLGERLGLKRGAGLVLGLLGALLIVLDGLRWDVTYAPRFGGDLLLVLSALAFASYTVIGRSLFRRQSPLLVTGVTNAISGIGFIPFAVVESAAFPFAAAALPAALLCVLYLGVVVSLLSFVWWNKALQHLEASQIAIFINLQPLVGAFLGWQVRGDAFTAATGIGGGLIISGVCLSLAAKRKGARESGAAAAVLSEA
jgi:drug/metabolite transporter (DMT)-like permease